ncbi:TIGR00645 family protein [Bosea sp. 117]|uniref:TIGR00645 family protein n=1 Tax=Bosea sp. 117 TaxID=1125973 RepID=UPI00049425CC|nr:TIGR00645 family protein [Bosea sp. 117]
MIVERVIERLILVSRWLMAPFYVGLIVALCVLLFKFVRELWHFVTYAPSFTESDTILGILALIDLTFTGSLVIIVIFSGYENFVSKIDGAGHPDWPEWMTKVDFSGLKQKLLASIIAISAIALLKAFMNLDKGVDEKQLYWLVVIHVVFVVSGIVLAWSDRIADKGDH